MSQGCSAANWSLGLELDSTYGASTSEGASNGPWYDASTVLVVPLDPDVEAMAEAAAERIPELAGVESASVLPLDAPPVDPEEAAVIVLLAGQGLPAVSVSVGTRSMVGRNGIADCGDHATPSLRSLPVEVLSSQGQFEPSLGTTIDAIHVVRAVEDFIEDIGGTGVALPPPPDLRAPDVTPARALLEDLRPIVRGMGATASSESMWLIPAGDLGARLRELGEAAVADGWNTRYLKADGHWTELGAVFDRADGCIRARPIDFGGSGPSILAVHAYRSEPDTDLAPAFSSMIDTAPIEDLLPYIGLASADQRARFFDRAVAAPRPDVPLLASLAVHHLEERDNLLAAGRFVMQAANLRWSGATFVEDGRIGRVAREIGIEDQIARPSDIRRLEELGYQRISPGESIQTSGGPDAVLRYYLVTDYDGEPLIEWAFVRLNPTHSLAVQTNAPVIEARIHFAEDSSSHSYGDLLRWSTLLPGRPDGSQRGMLDLMAFHRTNQIVVSVHVSPNGEEVELEASWLED